MMFNMFSSISDAIPKNGLNKAKSLSALLLGFSFLIICMSMCSCSTSRQVAIVDRTTHDTLYINKVQYDSIYTNDSYLMDYHPSLDFIYLFDSVLVMKVDTMYIHDKQVEYKYKYQHDTTYVHRVDTIPIIQQLEIVKEVPRPKTWFNHLCHYAFFLMCGFLLLFAYSFFRKFI